MSFSSAWRALWSSGSKTPALLVSLDALGTLYKFRKPVAVQYLEVAQNCGLREKIDPTELDDAFKASFKHHTAAYPNYGKGKLADPAEWWDLVVKQAFGNVVQGPLPTNLGFTLYEHFSSGAAYEPFSDVRPFLQSMAALKKRFINHQGPIVLTVVVTNSDPRAGAVLRDMGFRVGPSKYPTHQDVRQLFKKDLKTFDGFESVFRDYYNLNNDFDLLATSYDAGAAKPDSAIWNHTVALSLPTATSRAEQTLERSDKLLKNVFNTFETVKYRVDENKMMRIHIGDEYSKDYVGAKNAGWEALLISREENRSIPKDVMAVTSLNDVAMIVNVLASEFFQG